MGQAKKKRITVGKGEAKTKGYSQKVIVWGQ